MTILTFDELFSLYVEARAQRDEARRWARHFYERFCAAFDRECAAIDEINALRGELAAYREREQQA